MPRHAHLFDSTEIELEQKRRGRNPASQEEAKPWPMSWDTRGRGALALPERAPRLAVSVLGGDPDILEQMRIKIAQVLA